MIKGVLAATIAALVIAAAATASAPPVGKLPKGPVQTIQTTAGSLVAVALPHGANGRVWRQANAVDPKILSEVTEADVGNNVVIVFKAAGAGKVTIKYGLTRGETAHAYASRTYSVTVR